GTEIETAAGRGSSDVCSVAIDT
ncbi:hypothetical protein A2U01_0084463, partial [Trifolium medium]|nr:hypothetical protein [Trifolium medium]